MPTPTHDATRVNVVNSTIQVIGTTGQGQTLLFAKVDAAASGDNTIVSLNATKKIKVVSYVLVAAGAVSVKWRSGTTDLMGAAALAANGGIVAVGQPSAHLLETVVSGSLNLNISGSASLQVSGHISYFLEV